MALSRSGSISTPPGNPRIPSETLSRMGVCDRIHPSTIRNHSPSWGYAIGHHRVYPLASACHTLVVFSDLRLAGDEGPHRLTSAISLRALAQQRLMTRMHVNPPVARCVRAACAMDRRTPCFALDDVTDVDLLLPHGYTHRHTNVSLDGYSHESINFLECSIGLRTLRNRVPGLEQRVLSSTRWPSNHCVARSWWLYDPLPAPDPRDPKIGEKTPIFGPLRCKVEGEWGGSAH
jgi:hypothetical protein